MFCVKYQCQRTFWIDKNGLDHLRRPEPMDLRTAIDVAESSMYMADVYRISDDALVDYTPIGLTGNVISLEEAVEYERLQQLSQMSARQNAAKRMAHTFDADGRLLDLR